MSMRALRRLLSRAVHPLRLGWVVLAGESLELPAYLMARWPMLCHARWRRGGLPLRIGGWCLGRRSVAGITLWRTVFLAHEVSLSPSLVLHELAHVEQFVENYFFPVNYLWESLRHGYSRNRYELDADAFAAVRLHDWFLEN